MQIVLDDLSHPAVAEFLNQHIEDMLAVSPPESKHALDLDALKQPDIHFWTIWEGECVIACGAIKELDESHAEIKSMRVDANHRGRGLAIKMLNHILEHAKNKNYQRVSLETGSMAFFYPAHKLYQRAGFEICGPFADYVEDPHSLFMTKCI